LYGINLSLIGFKAVLFRRGTIAFLEDMAQQAILGVCGLGGMGISYIIDMALAAYGFSSYEVGFFVLLSTIATQIEWGYHHLCEFQDGFPFHINLTIMPFFVSFFQAIATKLKENLTNEPIPEGKAGGERADSHSE